MRCAGGNQLVAEGRAATEESGGRGHGGHPGQDPFFEPGAFAFAHGPEDVEHDVMGFGGEVDLAADFGHPQADPVVFHGRRDGLVLHGVTERSLRFADDDPVPPRSGSAISASSRDAWGRRSQGSALDTSVSCTILAMSALPATRLVATAICQRLESSGD